MLDKKNNNINYSNLFILVCLLWTIAIIVTLLLKFDINQMQNNYNNNIYDNELNTRLQSIALNQIENNINNNNQNYFYYITEEERYFIECIVAGESKGEILIGQMAVAQCILNAMQQNDYSPLEVKKYYQYSGWDDQLQNKDPEAWAQVCTAVSYIFDYGLLLTNENILYFYSPANVKTIPWHESQNFVFQIGGHKFFSPKE